ncbi:MAG: hypothetical protein J0L78_10615 [Planctomycetes bacterium]|nr:hypothetical protein [Planctomycetota bacterium]
MNIHNEQIDPTLRETDAMLHRAARADAGAARVLPGNPAGATLEDRVFSATKGVLNNTSPVIARIGPESVGRFGTAWKIAAAIAVIAGLGGAIVSLRPATAPTTIASSDPNKAAAEVELVLAAVSLLDEPLSGNFDQLAEDAARLHELVTTDRSYSAEPSEEKSKQGV